MRSLAPYRPIEVDDLIRLGRDADGGYVIGRRVCAATELLIGLGINDDWSFEADFVRQNPRVRIVGVDGSVSPEYWRRAAARNLLYSAMRLARGRPRFATVALGDAARNARKWWVMSRFFAPPHRFVYKYVTGADSPASVSWATLTRDLRVRPGGALPPTFVKMDIEESEYAVLPAVMRDADQLTGLAIEFHTTERYWDRFAALMGELQRSFAVVHMHGNNCAPIAGEPPLPSVLEISLVHRRLLTDAEQRRPSRRSYPVAGLDQPNDFRFADYVLEF